jgi:hypothetical protein
MTEHRADGMAEYGRPYQGLPAHKRYRRKKKLEGHDIEMEFEGRVISVSKKDKGIYCRGEGTWKRWADVTFEYDRFGSAIQRRIVCECGNQLREDVL